MLANQRELEVVGEAANGSEAVALCQRLNPELALLDLRMPEMDGLMATRVIRRTCGATRVVILTAFDNPHYALQAKRAGAAGYIYKDASRQEILTGLWQVLRDGAPIQPPRHTESGRDGEAEPAGAKAASPEALTSREREVLAPMVQGRTNREIARDLGITRATVKTHVTHIIAKLGVTDRTAAAARAVALGLVSWPPV